MTDTQGFNGQAFEAAVTRRKRRPFKFNVEAYVTDEAGEFVIDADGYLTSETVTLMVDPLVDALRLGAVFGALGKALDGWAEMASDVKVEMLSVELPKARARFRDCIIPTHRAEYDRVAENIGAVELADIVRRLNRELSGLDPTPPTSLPDGSPTTSTSSTDGAQPAVSTSGDSLSDVL